MILSSVLAWILVILLGLVFGSFLNVCISRLPQHRSIVWPGSSCPRCQAPIRPRDNIPLLSWLLLRGRCRVCRLPISRRYPLVEAGYAALTAGSFAQFGWSLDCLAASIFCFLALGLLVMDFETMLLPDAFILPGLMLGLLSAFVLGSTRPGPLSGSALDLGVAALGRSALAAAIWALVLFGIRWAYYAVRRRHGLGLGDVKLVAMLAAWLGFSRTALAFLLAVLAATIVGLGALSGRSLSRTGAYLTKQPSSPAAWGSMRLPLGFFLCASGLFAFFFGWEIITWYLSLFN